MIIRTTGKKILKVTSLTILSFAMTLTSIILPNTSLTDRADAAEDLSGKWVTSDGDTSDSRTICLGTSGIKNPAEDGGWSYVYYGKYQKSNEKSPKSVKYRVLQNKTTAYSGSTGKSTMFLDCDSVLYFTSFDGESPYSNVWYDDTKNPVYKSPIYLSLNESADGFYNKDGVFTTLEKDAIAESWKEAGSNVKCIDPNYLSGVSLNGEKIFLLEAEEATNPSYGYAESTYNNKNRRKVGLGTHSSWWWLRSPYSDNENGPYLVGFVNDNGKLDHDYVTLDEDDFYAGADGVSPAFNVNLESVIFTSLISGSAGDTGAEYKLALLDPGVAFDETAGKNPEINSDGTTVTIPYKVTGTYNRVSVMMLDKEYEAGNKNEATVKYYSKLTESDGEDGFKTGTFSLPDNYDPNWKIYIVAEQVNGGNDTDYASKPLKIDISSAISADTATALSGKRVAFVIGLTALAALVIVVFGVLVYKKSKKGDNV